MQQSYDVIVVGLGAMGSATLYQLAKRDTQVLGIDRYRPPHSFGSTHGESRITRLATGEGPAYVPFAKRSHAIWRELEEESGDSLLTLSGGLILCPKASSAHFHGQTDFVKQSAAIADAFGIDHTLYDAAAIRSRWPQLQIADREHAYYEPTGGIVNVEQAVATQLRLATEHGATIHTHEAVTALEHDAHGVTVTTTAGTYRAAKAIVSAGPWIGEFLPQAQAEPLAIYRQVIYWFAAEDPAQFHADNFPFLIWIGDCQEEFFSAFPYVAGGTVGVKLLTEQYVETTSAGTVDREVHPHEIEHMYQGYVQRRLTGILPTCLKTGVCLYTNTPDEHFLIDYHPDSERVLIVSPCSGHGFKHSAALGEALAQVTLEGKSALDMSGFGFGRFGG